MSDTIHTTGEPAKVENCQRYARFVREGAKELLRGIGQDILLGASLWPDVLRIETRWNLAGFTMRYVTRKEWEQRVCKAVRCLKTIRFELHEIERMNIACAQDELRDFEGIYGANELKNLLRQLEA